MLEVVAVQCAICKDILQVKKSYRSCKCEAIFMYMQKVGGELHCVEYIFDEPKKKRKKK